MWYNGGGRPHSSVARRTPYASSSRLYAFASSHEEHTRIRSDMLRLSSCANSHSAGCLQPSADCPRTSVLRYTAIRLVVLLAAARTLGRYRSLLLADARLCSDYRPALAAVRLLVYGSRKPHSANGSIAPTITNASVSAQATTPSEDSLCKGE